MNQIALNLKSQNVSALQMHQLCTRAHMRSEIVLVTTARPTLYIPSSTTWLFTNARWSGGARFPSFEFKFEVKCGL